MPSHTTSSHNFFPLISNMGLEQKSNSHSEMLSGLMSGSKKINSDDGSSSFSSPVRDGVGESSVGEETELSETELGEKWGDLVGKMRPFVEELEKYEILMGFERGRELELDF